jgi:hypothetical protein
LHIAPGRLDYGKKEKRFSPSNTPVKKEYSNMKKTLAVVTTLALTAAVAVQAQGPRPPAKGSPKGPSPRPAAVKVVPAKRAAKPAPKRHVKPVVVAKPAPKRHVKPVVVVKPAPKRHVKPVVVVKPAPKRHVKPVVVKPLPPPPRQVKVLPPPPPPKRPWWKIW